MRTYILPSLLLPLLLLSAPPAAQAAKKTRPAAKSSDYREIPAFNWDLAASGFMILFKDRNREIEASEPGRFFPRTVAFALGRIDGKGHFLKLNCGSTPSCGARASELEERMVYSTLLETIRTPKAAKEQLYDPRTWALTSLGLDYIEKLRKRYPDLDKRLGVLVRAAFGE
ncbi:MAG TPA: hypothetical protein PKK31_03385 [Elusimicrobiales bacterium]|nr:hypothetical protein [Elusimicrobiales bacterium]